MSDTEPAPEDIMLPPSPPEFSESSHKEASPLQTATVEQPHNESITTNMASSPFPSTFPMLPRTYSPMSKTHIRSRSLAGPPGSQSMTRAHSSPGLDSRGRYIFPGNQEKLPNPYDLQPRRPSPLRTSADGITSNHSNSSIHISETISEQPELQNSPTSTESLRLDVRSVSPSWSPVPHNSFPRSRRRPSSPLHSNHTSSPAGTTSPSPSHPPPLVISAKFNEPYPSYSFSSGSSMPSTPSSMRSRSPSISSLETIPDIPDAETAAIEADQIAKLKDAADKADAAAANSSNDMRRRSAIDMSGSPTPLGTARFGLRGSDKRKRWSVCGAEGRQDLDLETIWED